MKFEIKGRCTKLSIQPPPKGGERVESIRSCELIELGEGLCGKYTLKDIPHDVADRLAAGMTRGRRYICTVEIEEVPDPQLDLPLGSSASAEAH